MNKAHCHRLILRLFGYPQAELDGVPVRLARRKSWALLAYISLASTEIGRDTFAALLWPDYEGEQAFAYVRQSLWELNKALQGAIQSEGQKILISSEVERWVDVLHFQEILKRWQTRRSREALCLLEEAMALYRADFLAGFTLRDSPAFDDWQLSQAEVLRRQLGEVLTSLTEEYTAQGDLDMAIASIQRWLAMDPLDEARHRDLMRLYAWAGQRSAAIRQYESCAARLRSELRAAPEAATKELLEQIRSGAIRPPVKPMPAAPIPEIASRAPDSTLITPFAGREAELVQLKELLAQPECRLVTLVGPGGIGKTRLAREFAATYPHESVWVSLTTSSSAEQLVSVLADALSLTFRPVTDARPALEQELAQLAGHMRDRNLLLVLDNMEQLADVSPLLSNLLVKAPGIKMLATSRERLGLPEEWVFSVSGLPCPTIRAEESILCTAAVELFTRCAQRARADLAWQEEDWPALARICQLVEGMPLAIELAAAWVSVLSLQEIVAELEQGPDLLVSRQRGIAPRHASLRAVFEHSWGLLTERERVAFAQLSIFQGGFTRSAAAQVSLTPLETLSTLVDKSLLRRDTTGRYSIHPVLRQYAEEALRQMPAVRTEIGERHRTYNLDLLEAEGQRLMGPGQQEARKQLDAEAGNLRLALRQTLDQGDWDRMQQVLAYWLLYLEMHGFPGETFETLRPIIAAAREMKDRQPAWIAPRSVLALALAAWHFFGGRIRTPGTQEALKESIVLAQTLPNTLEKGFTLLLDSSGPGLSTNEALALASEAVAIFQAHRHLWGQAMAQLVWADAASFGERDYAQAEAVYRNSQKMFEMLENRWGQALCLWGLAYIAFERQEYSAALNLGEAGLGIHRGLNDPWRIGGTLSALARYAATAGDYERARSYWEENLALAFAHGQRSTAAHLLGELSKIARRQGDVREAKDYLAKGLALYQELGDAEGVEQVKRELTALD